MMKRLLAAALLTMSTLFSCGSFATTSEVTSSGFLASFHQDVDSPPQQAWEGITQIDQWWGSSHTYSGNAANLTLEAVAGGCWCEKWGANSVQHGRVLVAMPPAMLRLEGALGPLQALAVNAVLTFRIAKREGGSSIDVTYRVHGAPDAGLDKMAAGVDKVLEEQLARLFGLLSKTGATSNRGK